MKKNHASLIWDAIGLVGATLIGAGAGLIYLPAGLIVFGLMLLVAAVLAAKAD